MSTGKLVIGKFEDSGNFKSLYVTIPEKENSGNVKFSQWIEGNVEYKDSERSSRLIVKVGPKSSRLVVKIVSGEESKNIELDLCAKELNDSNEYVYLNNTDTATSLNDISSIQFNKDNTEFNHDEIPITNKFENNRGTSHTCFSNMDFSNALENSLQKVKENNAKIMENIRMLNRTLNYTKNKELLDIICPKSMQTYPCKVCGKCFVYETGLKRHYSMRHAIQGRPQDCVAQSRWQVVWTCIQCFQIWPQQEHAVLHYKACCITITDSAECVREIKTSLLLQCEFCEKVYTSIPRLLRHSKMHTTLNNYECNPCGLAFMSYKMVEHHWTLCPWQKTHYCYTLPKMLLCNACDRKFRNYEQLYNHRYKVGHFMTKQCTNTEHVDPKLPGVLVYQCELCNMWYNSVPEIMTHRTQQHQLLNYGMSNSI